MYSALTCLAFEHDHRLVTLAAIICIVGAVTAVRSLQLASESELSRQTFWISASALAGGGSVWSTHFIAMMAYDPGIVLGYALWPTVTSLVVAVLGAAIGFLAFVQLPKAGPYVGGIILGGAIVALHYLGMAGILVPGHITWDVPTIGLSILFSVVFSVLSLCAIRPPGSYRSQILGAASLIAGVVLLLSPVWARSGSCRTPPSKCRAGTSRVMCSHSVPRWFALSSLR